MKIAYIIPSLAKSGPIKVVHQLVENLFKDYEIDVYYFKTPMNREILSFDVPVYNIKFSDKIDFNDYDIIHSHGVLPDAYVWWHRKAIEKSKTVTTLHNYAKEDFDYNYGKVKSFFMVRLWSLVTSEHDQVVTLSRDAVKYYRKIWKNKQITYVYNGIPNRKQIEKTTRKKESTPIKIGAIASAGGVNRTKGLEQVIKAMPELSEYVFYIVGKETEESESLKELAGQLGVSNRVKFLGYHSDIEAFIDDMDLFVVSARSEGFSLALQEIVRHQKPVVCSDIPIFRELFSEEELRFFTLDDIDSLVMAIRDISLKDDTLVENAYNKFLSMYTSEKMAENYLAIYTSLLKG
ncbi:MAG: glycosyltransferase [Sulfurovum sp.]|nr:glycosyltransferase [Sulfurovum sp.]